MTSSTMLDQLILWSFTSRWILAFTGIDIYFFNVGWLTFDQEVIIFDKPVYSLYLEILVINSFFLLNE